MQEPDSKRYENTKKRYTTTEKVSLLKESGWKSKQERFSDGSIYQMWYRKDHKYNMAFTTAWKWYLKGIK